MRPRPIDHFARLVSAAIVDATCKGIGDCAGESRTADDVERVVAANGPLQTVIVRVCRSGWSSVRHALIVVRGAEVLVV